MFDRKLRNAMDGFSLHIAVSTEEALKVLRPARMEVLSVRKSCPSELCADQADGPVHCL